MSELSDAVAGLGELRLRQSRAIAKLLDRHTAAFAAAASPARRVPTDRMVEAAMDAYAEGAEGDIYIDMKRMRAALEAALAAELVVERASTGHDEDSDFMLNVLAVALDRPPTEVDNLGGSVLELPPLVRQVMRLAGFAPSGEAAPAGSPSIAGSNGSITVSPPATDMSLQPSAN